MASFRGILNIQSLNEPHFAGNPNPAPDADPHFEQPPQLEPSGGGTTSWLDLTVIQSDTEATSSIRSCLTIVCESACRCAACHLCSVKHDFRREVRSISAARPDDPIGGPAEPHGPDPCAKKRLRRYEKA